MLTDPGKPFGLSADEAREVVDAWRALAEVVSPESRLCVCRDEDDNSVLECALDSHAEYIITGDGDLLDLGEFKGIKIVRVSDCLQLLENMRGEVE